MTDANRDPIRRELSEKEARTLLRDASIRMPMWEPDYARATRLENGWVFYHDKPEDGFVPVNDVPWVVSDNGLVGLASTVDKAEEVLSLLMEADNGISLDDAKALLPVDASQYFVRRVKDGWWFRWDSRIKHPRPRDMQEMWVVSDTGSVASVPSIMDVDSVLRRLA